MTHKELVQLGAQYMRRTMRCSPVATERRTMATNEVPDIIGWQMQSGHNRVRNNPFYFLDSILIEVKASSADFLQDKKKPHRQHGNVIGVGRCRVF